MEEEEVEAVVRGGGYRNRKRRAVLSMFQCFSPTVIIIQCYTDETIIIWLIYTC